MFDDGTSVVAEHPVQVHAILTNTEGVTVQEVLDAPIDKDVLHPLRTQQALDQVPSLGDIQVFLIHGSEPVQGAIALGIHPKINIPAVLVGTVAGQPASSLRGEIAEIEVTAVRVLLLHLVYSIEECAHHFWGGIDAVVVP
jgi:hypothetical protein